MQLFPPTPQIIVSYIEGGEVDVAEGKGREGERISMDCNYCTFPFLMYLDDSLWMAYAGPDPPDNIQSMHTFHHILVPDYSVHCGSTVAMATRS